MRSTGNLDLDAALHALRKAVANCPGTDGRRIARNNARSKVLASLRRVRKLLDENYPAIRLERAPKRLKTAKGRLERLRRAGWRDVFELEVGRFAALGIPVKRVKVAQEASGEMIRREYFFVPAWADAIGVDHPTQLRQAKKSVRARQAALAAEALR